MTVDAERLLSAFLRAQTTITELVSDRVYTDLPSRATFPLIRLTLIGGEPPYSVPLHLDRAYLQIDCYGGPKFLARQIVDVVRDLMAAETFRTYHDDLGVVSDVEFGQLAYLPDVTFDPPKPRYMAEVTLLTHP